MSIKVLSRELTQKERTVFEGLLSRIPQYQKQHQDKESVTNTIRTAIVSDIPQIIKLFYNTWVEEPSYKGLTYSKIKGRIKTSLESNNPIMLVAEQRGNVIAFVWGYDISKDKQPLLTNYLSKDTHTHVSYIDEIAVDPSFRGHGIGTELLDNYKKLAKQKGVDNLVLDVLIMNHEARKLYERKGYKPIVDPTSKQEIFEKVEGGVYQYFHLDI